MNKVFNIIALVLVVFSAGCLFLINNNTSFIRAFTVISASMEPAIITGSLIITQKADTKTLQKGDVITFTQPTNTRLLITHRILQVAHNHSITNFLTKGDNNKHGDNWVVAEGAVVGKVVTVVPYLGRVLSFITSKPGLIIFVLFPSLYVLSVEISTIAAVIKHIRGNAASHPTELLMVLFAISICVCLQAEKSYAYLSDNSRLNNNVFAAIVSPSTSSGQIIISNNGNNSHNTVVNTTNNTVVIQSSTTSEQTVTVTNSSD